MGQLKHDGRATQGGVTFPAGIISFGDLYRVGGWNGIALDSLVAADTVRTMDMEISAERIWYVKIPAALAAVKGSLLYWADPTVFQRGDTNLQATPATAGDAPACKVEEDVDANDYCAIRVLNDGGGGAVASGVAFTASFVIGAEAANVINVGVQLKDADGVDLAVHGSVFGYLSDDANGNSITATVPSGGFVIGTDGLAIEVVADKAAHFISEADGDIDINITHTGTNDYYLVLVMPNGKLVVSAIINFA